MDKFMLGIIAALFLVLAVGAACNLPIVGQIPDPVDEARADAVRIQAEADKQIQIMAANQDAADRAQARNSGTNWPAIMVAVIIFQSIVFVAILLFVLSYQRKAIQRNDIKQAGIIKVGSAQYIVHRDQHGQGIPYLEEIHHE